MVLVDEGEGDHRLGDDDPPLLPVAAGRSGYQNCRRRGWRDSRTRLESFSQPCQVPLGSQEEEDAESLQLHLRGMKSRQVSFCLRYGIRKMLVPEIDVSRMILALDQHVI